MTNNDTSPNERHYDRMLSAFPATWTTEALSATIATLEFLVEALEEPSLEWKASFRKHWGTLEEVNALVLDEGRTRFSSAEKEVLNNARLELQELIRSVHPRSDDPKIK